MNKIIELKKRKYFLILFTSILITSITFASSVNDSTNTEVFYRIILIGDAGEPAKDHPEPVLVALKKEASLVDSTVVVILGDNIYPNGLPDENHKKRKEYERRLDEQINAIKDLTSAAYFISGNHDWASDNHVGWKQLKRQADYILDKNLSHIKFVPLNACPGPELVSFGSKINLIFLDSQWFLQKKGRPAPDDCTG
jgi:predicted MPP superfamily phosphohydrolase